MVKMRVQYEGNLRCRLTHDPSQSEILTDAPVDNMGKGEAFSPTDLLASALGSCMLTVMGIAADRHAIHLKGTRAEVIKEMVNQPIRRIGKISIVFHMAQGIPSDKRSILEHAALNCPVYKSLNPEIELAVQFVYPD